MGDKSKAITLRVNKEDLRSLSKSVLASILKRMNETGSECMTQISQNLEDGTPMEILEGLENYISIISLAIDEINDISPLVLEIYDSPSSDTESLEDLPDLEEDSLRVNSGSE
jgi:hypothetical protein